MFKGPRGHSWISHIIAVPFTVVSMLIITICRYFSKGTISIVEVSFDQINAIENGRNLLNKVETRFKSRIMS